jgi:D-alanyl-D-alanine carboxypeptidase
MHEQGLAIDFTCNGGGSIESHSNVCYQWLAAHASQYGFHNLPSEAWHWSVNGH